MVFGRPSSSVFASDRARYLSPVSATTLVFQASVKAADSLAQPQTSSSSSTVVTRPSTYATRSVCQSPSQVSDASAPAATACASRTASAAPASPAAKSAVAAASASASLAASRTSSASFARRTVGAARSYLVYTWSATMVLSHQALSKENSVVVPGRPSARRQALRPAQSPSS